MKSIGTRFSVVVGVCAVIFCSLILWRAWASARQQAEEWASAETALAIEFDVAVQDYVRSIVRPEMAKRVDPEEFVVETMSTSYVARHVFEKVRQQFPDYLLKFPSDNPRNPKNTASEKERELLQYFREDPNRKRWEGRLSIDGHEYWAHVSALRITKACLQCHGSPQDAPQALLARYGASGGFGWNAGDVNGAAMIAIPMDSVNATLAHDAWQNLLFSLAWLVALSGIILIAFRLMVASRLAAMTRHFQAAASEETPAIDPAPVSGNDEISTMARSFNSLAERLRHLHATLEDQVRQRTHELSEASESLREEVVQRTGAEQALLREQRLLKRSLRMNDAERHVIAYEIHDGLAQALAAAIMAFQAFDRLKREDPAEAEKQHETGVELLLQCLAEARRLIDGVRPPLLDEQGVLAAVQNLLSECQKGEGPEIEFHHSAHFERLEPVIENAIYRIVQESLNNALQHSGSDRVQVSLRQEQSRVRVTVRDWGVGFDVKEKKRHAMGLRGIRARAKSLGGVVTIESQAGHGTTISVDLPLESQDDPSEDSDV